MNIPQKLQHPILALLIQAPGYFFDYGLIILGAGAVMLFLGREIGQNEYQWMKMHHVNRSKMPWYKGISYGWDKKSRLDFVLPAICCAVVAVLLG